MKFCTECYRLLDDSARFCDKCGSAQYPYQYSQPVKQPPTQVQPQPPEPQPEVVSPALEPEPTDIPPQPEPALAPPEPQPAAVSPLPQPGPVAVPSPSRGIQGIGMPNSLRKAAIPIAIVASALIARAIALTAIPIDPYWDRVEE